MERQGRGRRERFFSVIVLTQRENPKSENRPSGSTLHFRSHPHVSSLPFHNPRTNFSFAADLQRTRRTNGGSLWQGRRTRSTLGAKHRPASVGLREIHLTTRTLDLPPGSDGFSFISAIRRD